MFKEISAISKNYAMVKIENISNEDKNKIQSSNQNTRQINKKKLSEIDIQQIRNLFKQKQFIPFTKTVNHFSNNKKAHLQSRCAFFWGVLTKKKPTEYLKINRV